MIEHLRSLLATPGVTFAIGVPGAIAEFSRSAAECSPSSPQSDTGVIEQLTARGALRLRAMAGARLEGPQTLDAHGHAARTPTRHHRVTIPSSEARLGARRTIAELGADADAIAREHRDQVLFDMGLGIEHLDACVRTRDPDLIATLRASEGRRVFDADVPAMAAIKRTSPTRVFVSRFARIEVYQPIPSRSRGERTPEGPHTHVLPALLETSNAPDERATVLEIFEPVS